MTPEQKENLINEIENYFGGPASWPGNISPTDQDSEDDLIRVWDAAIKMAVKKIREMK